MTDQVEIALPLTIVDEETTFTATVYHRTRPAKEALIPTTIHYRVDCLSNKRQVTGWTSVAAPAESNVITITATENQILDDSFNIETKQLTVKLDSGLSTQQIKPITWKVRNLQGIR
jgi:hypothetical protein